MPGPMRGGQKPPKKPKNAKKTVARLFSYMNQYSLRLILVAVFVIFSSLAQLIGTLLLGRVVDDYLEPIVKNGRTDELFNGFVTTIILMGIVYFIGAVCSYLYSRIMLTVSTSTLLKIRTQLFAKMQTLPIKYFDTHTHGSLMSLYTNDTDTLRELLSNSIAQFISCTISVVGALILMFYYSWQLTLIVFVIVFVMFQIIKLIGGKSGHYYMLQQKNIGTVNGYIEEFVEGQRVVKVFCHEDKSKEEFAKINDELCSTSTKANTFGSILMPIMNNLSHIHYAITAVAGGLLVINGVSSFGKTITVGAVIAFLELVRRFSQPITQISQQMNVVMTALAGAERIFGVLDEESETDNGYVTLVKAKYNDKNELVEADGADGVWAWRHPHKKDGTVTYTKVEGNVTFDDVVFSYDGIKTVLNGISLYAKPGQKIAFVGSTGAGKTTITNLINRFYDVPDGKIRYDGININKIKKADLRRSLSMVLQDTHLFTGTVEDNIRYGKLDATYEDIERAAKLANAHSFITHLPNGYKTMLTADGANLSQGQRQLIAIARAAVADPPVLILDEATSSIDTRTEKLIEKGMDSLMEGRTVFVIAHRLSTVRNSNAIMVLENGKIIERGDHESLIALKGRYYSLYTGMFELS